MFLVFVLSNRPGIITILSEGLILPNDCLVSVLVSSAIVATPLRRCEFTKSNVFSNNLSSSTPSKSGGFGRPLNTNSYIPISFIPILSVCPVTLAFFVFFLVFAIGSPNSASCLSLWGFAPLF